MPMSLRPFLVFASSAALILSVAACDQAQRNAEAVADMGPAGWLQQLFDGSDGRDWPAFGRTYGEQHYSPLTAINSGNVAKLGLAWSYDLPVGNPVSGPIAVSGL